MTVLEHFPKLAPASETINICLYGYIKEYASNILGQFVRNLSLFLTWVTDCHGKRNIPFPKKTTVYYKCYICKNNSSIQIID